MVEGWRSQASVARPSVSGPWKCRFLKKLGANFKQQFDENTYRELFRKMGYTDVIYHIVEGRMACDIAVIEISETK